MSNTRSRALVGFQADAGLRAQIEAAAGARHGAISDLLRRAVTEHLARIADADLEAGPTKVSFLVGSIFDATSTIAARSAAELADLASAYRAAAEQAGLGADDRAALTRAADFLKGSADALRCLADRFRLSPSTANGEK
ncbi:MAG: hypothetical protein KF904_16595 [Rhodoblastus sp.]|nr:hypothetical protein [Rhodoblastus sp.]